MYCAIDEAVEKDSGKYFENCHQKTPMMWNKVVDDGQSKKLWEVSERICGI
eukprot:CAMPEP_0114593780 /NCGR_PEP_ID=MMETSP0125-20121206/15372_1 /TAXON_ID=485358 ORGANISM="Aristerostoma sp., Strain ATCC 50986" /NCGR_SAMPLE_ID=MMETSP0125 /ASSEMBLY_ACC=CAM_ASM_000245 /LENGTH=50 /DNA_ID=CAMNT_0001793297 /DNA_START=532 /DNA_END=684 /DNA_ORIENTATION=-